MTYTALNAPRTRDIPRDVATAAPRRRRRRRHRATRDADGERLDASADRREPRARAVESRARRRRDGIREGARPRALIHDGRRTTRATRDGRRANGRDADAVTTRATTRAMAMATTTVVRARMRTGTLGRRETGRARGRRANGDAATRAGRRRDVAWVRAMKGAGDGRRWFAADAVQTEMDDVELASLLAETSEGAESAAAASEEGKRNNFGYVLAAMVVVLLAAAGLTYKDELFASLGAFTDYIESLGPTGYALFLMGYVALEVLAVPAFPLTMSAGALFGTYSGTLLVTTAATIAAAIAFLISRYVARDKVMSLAEKYPKFKAIDKAIGEDSLRVVAIMRLSPLMPFALSNYLYGLTSVKFRSYVVGSFFGMMPGTFAYVSAGTATRQVAEGALGGSAVLSTLFGVGLAIFSAGYVGKLATKAVEEETGTCFTEDCTLDQDSFDEDST